MYPFPSILQLHFQFCIGLMCNTKGVNTLHDPIKCKTGSASLALARKKM